MMEEAGFWQIVDSSRQRARETKRRPDEDFIELHKQTLAEALRCLPPAEIVAFHERFWYYHSLTYRWDLWAAAYWLHGGCGNDGFINFRSCLISLGKELFFQVSKDPDSMAEIVGRPDTPYLQSEGFQYVAARVYKEKTGADIPHGETKESAKPAGRQFDFDDKDVMCRRFPKIVAKFPDMGD